MVRGDNGLMMSSEQPKIIGKCVKTCKLRALWRRLGDQQDFWYNNHVESVTYGKKRGPSKLQPHMVEKHSGIQNRQHNNLGKGNKKTEDMRAIEGMAKKWSHNEACNV